MTRQPICLHSASRVRRGLARGALFALSVLASTALAACAQGSAPAASTAPSSAPATSSAPTSSPSVLAKAAATNTPDAKAREAALYEAARKEGAVTYYGSLEAKDAQDLINAFGKRYPGVKVEHYRATSQELREKAFAEFKAGRFEADTYGLGTADFFYMQKEGMLQKRAWSAAASYPRDRIDPEGYWIGVRYALYTPSYNTRLVPAAEAPRTWDDLLDARWMGKVGLEQDAVEWFASLIIDRGREKGMEFMRKLVELKPQLRSGHTNLTQMLAAGEFAVAIESFPYHVESQKDRKAPVEWVKVNPAYSSGVLAIAISSKAPHPNAAQLWAEWQTSDEGQRVYAEIGRPPANPDAPIANPAVQEMAKLKTIFLPSSWIQDETKYREEFQGLFWPKKN